MTKVTDKSEQVGKAQVIFTPSGMRGDFAKDTSLLTVAQQTGADLDSVCGGNGICGRCKILVSEGEFSKFGFTSSRENLNEPTSIERAFFSKKELEKGYRLACNVFVKDNVVIDIPPESQVQQQLVRKAAGKLDVEAAPAIKLITIEVTEADMHDQSGDFERIQEMVEFETGIEDIEISLPILAQIQVALRKGKWQVTVAIAHKESIVAVWPGEQTALYGVAVDIGSTSIAAHLSDLSSGENIATTGQMNPQIRYGEDLMSRVSYIMMNPGGEVDLTDSVREAVNNLVQQLVTDSGVDKSTILDMVLVGNPIMHHLFLGLNPVELGTAPFALTRQGSVHCTAAEVGIDLNPGTQVYMLPCIAGHVGADAAAVVLSQAPYKNPDITLVVDVGTNAEIILGNADKLVAASSPTGPAFEGAQIEHGQRAAPGAIERLRIDPVTYAPKFKVIGCDLWSDEEGFAESTAATGVTGICGSGIIEAIAELMLSGLVLNEGVYNAELLDGNEHLFQNGKTLAYRVTPADEKGQGGIIITQNDIRAIQLAKATLYASIELLMDKLGIKEIARIELAGAFGAHIDPKYALALGLIPDCDVDQVRAVGNAAGTGARIALLNVAARREIEDQVLKMTKIETAIEPKFQDYFIAAMGIPHKQHDFVHLRKALPQLPVLSAQAQDAAPTRRRRRSSRGGRPNISR